MQFLRYQFIAMLYFFTICGTLCAEESEILRKNLLGQVPPEIVGERNQWMGKSPPVTLAEFKGKVVWLQFNF